HFRPPWAELTTPHYVRLPARRAIVPDDGHPDTLVQVGLYGGLAQGRPPHMWPAHASGAKCRCRKPLPARRPRIIPMRLCPGNRRTDLKLREGKTVKLYYSPLACSLADHIALVESGVSFEREAVDLKTKRTVSGADFTEVTRK